MRIFRRTRRETATSPCGSPRSRKRADILALLGLTALSVGFFWRGILTDRAPIWGDILVAFYPVHYLWRTFVLRGDLPLWNPFIFTGMPLLADSQYSSLYPSMVLNLFLPLHRALVADLALHTLMLSVFTYAFLRRLSLSGMSAFLGAVTFAFSGFVAVRVHHVSLIRTMAWLPLLLYVVADFTPRRNIVRSSIPLAAVLAVMTFAGHMQTTLISGLLAIVFGLSRIGSFRGSEGAQGKSPLVAFVAAFALGSVLAFALAAAQILPAAELVWQSDRGGGTDYSFATSFSLPLRQLPMLVSPGLFGTPTQGMYWGEWLYWEMVGYAGIAPLALGIAAVLLATRRDRFFWLFVGVAGVGLALGRGFVLYPAAYWLVPGVAYFRVPARFLMWYTFAVAVLAAMGLEALQQGDIRRRQWIGFLLFAAATAVGGAYWAAGGSRALEVVRSLAQGALESARFFPRSMTAAALSLVGDVARWEGHRFLMLWTGAASLIVVARISRRTVPLAVVLLALLSVADLFSFGMDFYPTAEAQDLYRSPPATKLLDVESGKYRILTTPRLSSASWQGVMTFRSGVDDSLGLMEFRKTLVPNLNVQYGIPNVLGYSPIVFIPPQQVIGLAIAQAAGNAGRSPLLDFLGTRYILTPARLGPPLQSVYVDRYYIWRSDSALPRGYLVSRYVVEPDEERRGRLISGGVDLRRTVVLDRAPPSASWAPHNEPGRILRRSYDLSRVSFDVELTGPAILVLSDAYYPGWHAYVDGTRRPVLRANHAFRAVSLPPHAKRVEFVYEPITVKAGLMISGVAWSLLVAAWFLSVWQGGRARRAQGAL